MVAEFLKNWQNTILVEPWLGYLQIRHLKNEEKLPLRLTIPLLLRILF